MGAAWRCTGDFRFSYNGGFCEGLLIISLPNIANWQIRLSLLQGKFDYSEEGLLDSGHIRFFTYNSALKMIQTAGYEIVKSDVAITLPKLLSKLDKSFPILSIHSIAQNYFKNLFGYQFIFVCRKER